MIAAHNSTADQALAYARRGWPVLPCRPGGKEPATKHGFRDASTDPDQIGHWWRRIPGANLAIATGLPGPDVLDVDQHGPAGSGYPALARLRREGLLDGVGPIVATPGGGLHLYFTGSGQASARLPSQHLDFKAGGGYVLAPPSRIGGRPYHLVSPRATFASLDWTAATLLLEPGHDRPVVRTPAVPCDLGRLAAWVERLEEGSRNSGLFWAACRAVEAGQLAVLDDLAAAAARTGLTEREIARTIRSSRRGRGRWSERQAEREAAR